MGSPTPVLCFQTTYEELKQLRLEWGSVEVRLPDYLWGIETIKHKHCSSESPGLLPDYLWGIETDKRKHRLNWRIGFQTTYEELKHHFPWYIVEELSCFQTTYEELKPELTAISAPVAWASRLPMRNWNPLREWVVCKLVFGFQTTYEELKPSMTNSLWLVNPASRLPMRNWNAINYGYTPADGWLPDYLWGIETSSSWQLGNLSRASRLPMRNWNDVTVFRWKTGKALPDYLWGIETTAGLLFHRILNPLPDYLWGIETSNYELHGITPFASRLPMRNWNFGGLLLNALIHASRLPMRNWNAHYQLYSLSCVYSFQTTYEELKPTFLQVSSSKYVLPDYLWGIETWNRRF